MDKLRELANKLSYEYDVHVLVTLGSSGSIYVYKDMVNRVPAIRTNAIDTTAAGDTYIGAFVSRINMHDSILDAMLFATRASSITVSTKGAQTSIPYLNQLI